MRLDFSFKLLDLQQYVQCILVVGLLYCTVRVLVLGESKLEPVRGMYDVNLNLEVTFR